MRIAMVSAVTAVVLGVGGGAFAGEIEDLQKQVSTLSEQVKALSEKEKKTETGDGGSYAKKVWQNTRFGGYGELDYTLVKNNGNGKGGGKFDPHRFVLYVNSDLNDWITLNTELEWEHGGVKDSVSDEGELSGEVAVEQAFLDFKFSKAFNVKAGVMLMPVGGVNLYHEPTNFNSAERPSLDRILIPSTWSEMGAGIHGALTDKVDYQLLVVTGLDGEEFSAKNGIRDGRQNLNADNNRGKAVTGRIEVRPLTNLYTNFSFYTGNSAKTGDAYTTIAAFDGKYSIDRFDLSGEYVHIYQDKPGKLSNEIGHNMSGYWVEGAAHVLPRSLKKGKLSDADAIVFARYSELDTQQGKIADPTKASGKYDRNYTNLGVVFKPTTTVSIKADYQIYDDQRKAGEKALDNDKFQVTLGFVF